MDNYNQPGFGYEQSERTVAGDYREREFIVVSNQAKVTLKSITKWVKFLTILGMIGCVFIFVIGIVAILFGGYIGSRFGGSGAAISATTGLLYIVIGIIYVYPLIKLLNYANKMKAAIISDNQANYEIALTNFNSAVIFWGVLAITGLVIWGLALILFILGVALS